jgi:hypothetical protein
MTWTEMIFEIITNLIFLSCILSIVVVQIIKMLIDIFYHKNRFELRNIINTGGMPSSHSAVVSALTTSVLVLEGLSTITYVSFFLSGIVIRDAFGLRWDTGLQAKAINAIAKESKNKEISKVKLNENIGHTFLQVLIGMAIGILTAVLVSLASA